MPKPAAKSPAFLDAARAFYGEAFEHTRKRDLARSITEWGDMDEDEQSFAQAHLLSGQRRRPLPLMSASTARPEAACDGRTLGPPVPIGSVASGRRRPEIPPDRGDPLSVG